MARQAGAKPSAGAAKAAPDGKAQAGKPEPQRLTLTRAAGLSTDVRTLAVNLTILAVIILVVPVIASQFLREQVLIEPIAVPEALLATGLTPEVAANRLWDGLKEVKEAAGSSKGSVTAIPDSKQVDFSIPDSGLSIDSLIYYVRQFFNAYETRIGGEFRCADPACSPAGITLRLRVVRDDMELLQLPPMGPRAEAEYFRDAAGEVMAVLDPFTAIAADAAAEPKRAQVLARRLIRSGHKDAKWAHNLIGNMLLDDNDIAGAETAYRAALALDPDFPTARTNLGNALRIKGDVAGAREAFAAVEKARPGDVFAAQGLADLALLDGKPDDAIALLLAAADRDPVETVYYLKAGTIEFNRSRPDEAKAHWMRALEIDPGDAGALALLAHQYLLEENYGEAERLYRDAADYEPEEASLQGQHADLLLLVGKQDEALRRADSAIRLAPDVAAYRISRASALYYLERPAEALEELARAAEIEPANPKIAYEMATNLRALGRNEEAVAAYRRFIGLDPDALMRPVVEMFIEQLTAGETAVPQPVEAQSSAG